MNIKHVKDVCCGIAAIGVAAIGLKVAYKNFSDLMPVQVVGSHNRIERIRKYELDRGLAEGDIVLDNGIYYYKYVLE